MHRITLSTGEEKLDTENPGSVVGWTTDNDFVVRAATAVNPKTGGYDLMVREKPGAEWKTSSSGRTRKRAPAAGFGKDPNTLYVIGNHDANTLAAHEARPRDRQGRA